MLVNTVLVTIKALGVFFLPKNAEISLQNMLCIKECFGDSSALQCYMQKRLHSA